MVASVGKKKTGPKRKGPPLPADALGARVEAARRRARLSQGELGKKAGGLTHAAISKIESGATKDPGKATLVTLAQILKDDFGVDWLRQYIQPSAVVELAKRQGITTGGIEINVLGRVAAGKPIQQFKTDETIIIPNRMLGRGKETFALQVQGHSMIGVGIFHADIVVLHENPEPLNGQVVVVQMKDYEYTLKIWQRKGRKIALRPANPEFDKIELKAGVDEVRCVGEFAGLIRFAR